ncbi:MAG: hypothetical protein I8H88_06780 [Burkholderiales bacterium]|nr:hypothetical protein [Burkholderiales bacterium]
MLYSPLTPSTTLSRLTAAVLLAGAAVASAAHASGINVGVSVGVSQPGFYGRVDIGDQRPVLLYPQPVIIQSSPYGHRQRPIYMRVPPGHSKNWGRYCAQYGACGQPVYFVRDNGRNDRRDDRRDDHRDHGGWDRHDHDDHGHDHGHGKGHNGRGHGRGRD